MRSLAGARFALALLLGALAADTARGEEVVTLEGPDGVEGLLRSDATGDGIQDLLLLSGREVWVYAGSAAGLPGPAPTHRVKLPDDANFVDASPPAAAGGAGLLALAPSGLWHLDLEGGAATRLEAAPVLAWTDSRKAAFVDFARPDGEIRLPTASGWLCLMPPGRGATAVHVPAKPEQQIEPAGDFLEDQTRLVFGHPPLVDGAAPRGAPEGSPPTRWALSGRELVAFRGEERAAYDVSFLPSRGLRRLVDLDGDQTPDLFHQAATNQQGTYAFFRTPPPIDVDGTLRLTSSSLLPPATVLRLEGFQLEPDLVDLDGDGHLDFVVTTIPIDARNTARALQGAVTASTHAFLHRSGDGYFAQSPDVSLVSDIGVAIRLTQRGNIDVQRSFTIVKDADVDGDGRKDLVIRTHDDALTVYRGVPAGVWEREGRALPIPPRGPSPNVEGYAADLTGDGRDELVLLYRRPPGGRDLVRVVRP